MFLPYVYCRVCLKHSCYQVCFAEGDSRNSRNAELNCVYAALCFNRNAGDTGDSSLIYLQKYCPQSIIRKQKVLFPLVAFVLQQTFRN